MIDVSTIRVIPFCGEVNELPVWSEKFLSKAKRYGFKDLLQGNLSIPIPNLMKALVMIQTKERRC
jgi:hypothetical protein